MTLIELTGTVIRGIPNRKFGLFKMPALRLPSARRVRFDIPYASITSMRVYPHPARLGLMDVLDIQYGNQGGVSKKSICSYSNNIRQAEYFIAGFRPDLLAK